MDVLAPWLGLIVWCMLKELLSSDSRREVILMLDETANFRVDGLVEKLTILAGYQCRAITVLQSFSVNDNLILTHLPHKSGNLNLTHPWFFH
jgi:type IV secretory pathway TraG/TraD family ATPase VirD4